MSNFTVIEETTETFSVIVNQGLQGPSGNTILNGIVNPTTQGVDGDFYINTATLYIFGPKAAGVWPAGVPLSGGGGGSVLKKCGVESFNTFAGTPLKKTVTFSNAYADDLYTINLSGTDARIFTYESKTASGFVINTNADTALSGEVSWQTFRIGETT